MRIKELFHRSGSPSSFCNAPFISMYFGFDGAVTSCCYNRSFLLGTYPDQDLWKIWRGEPIRKLRNYLKRKDLSHGCSDCEYWSNTDNKEDLHASVYNRFKINKRYPVFLEFELSNKCNLECIMCKGEFSSMIRKYREKLPPRRKYYDTNFIDQLERFIPNLQEAQFCGGEPFLEDLNFLIWERIIALNPNCRIAVQTNGTILNDRVKDILSRGNFRIGISLDSVHKELYEKIRVNARFETVMSNIHFFADYCHSRNNVFHISACPMRINWHEMPDLVKFCNTHQAYIRFNKVKQPVKYALWNLSPIELKKIHNSLSTIYLDETDYLSRVNKEYFNYFLIQILIWYKDALKRQDEIDRIKNIDIHELKNEIYQKIVEYCSQSSTMEASECEECIRKLDAVISMFSNDNNLKIMLKEFIDENPISEILSEVKKNSIESLYHKAKSVLEPHDPDFPESI